jgi:hypothetical protein
MAHTANPSTLDSVFLIKSDVKSWPKLDDERLLSQLHAKFWRKSMVEEEEEWRSNSGADDYGDDDDGVYDCDDDDYYDWEIGPGCYALDFGIENLERSKLWVRRDYLRIYKYCGTHYDKVKNFSGRVAPSVVITGHPGVGECSAPSDHVPSSTVSGV